MAAFERGDVVKVPFPYTDRATRQHRPALVVSSWETQSAHGVLWILMTTSAENRGWRGDIPIREIDVAGLPAPSVVRTAKIATIEAADAGLLGRLKPAVMRRVADALARELGIG